MIRIWDKSGKKESLYIILLILIVILFIILPIIFIGKQYDDYKYSNQKADGFSIDSFNVVLLLKIIKCLLRKI